MSEKPLYTVTEKSIASSKKEEPKDPGYNSGTHELVFSSNEAKKKGDKEYY